VSTGRRQGLEVVRRDVGPRAQQVDALDAEAVGDDQCELRVCDVGVAESGAVVHRAPF